MIDFKTHATSKKYIETLQDDFQTHKLRAIVLYFLFPVNGLNLHSAVLRHMPLVAWGNRVIGQEAEVEIMFSCKYVLTLGSW